MNYSSVSPPPLLPLNLSPHNLPRFYQSLTTLSGLLQSLSTPPPLPSASIPLKAKMDHFSIKPTWSESQ